MCFARLLDLFARFFTLTMMAMEGGEEWRETREITQFNDGFVGLRDVFKELELQ